MKSREAWQTHRSLVFALLVVFSQPVVSSEIPVMAGVVPKAHRALPAQCEQSFHRSYKATAYISVLSIPILSRSGVGFGSATANERAEGETHILKMQFSSGSNLDRAHGLNRFGAIQETVEEKQHSTVRADYFGVMTASGEESLAEGKRVLASKTGETMPYVAAEATVDGNTARYAVRHMLLPSSYRMLNTEELISKVQPAFETGPPPKALNGRDLSTFLFSLHQAMVAPESVFDQRFTYNGRMFRLHTEKHRDPKSCGDLRKVGPTNTADDYVTQLSGTIRNELTNEQTGFRLWFDASSPNFLPLRFEFKPKAYLKLVFDAEGEAPRP